MQRGFVVPGLKRSLPPKSDDGIAVGGVGSGNSGGGEATDTPAAKLHRLNQWGAAPASAAGGGRTPDSSPSAGGKENLTPSHPPGVCAVAGAGAAAGAATKPAVAAAALPLPALAAAPRPPLGGLRRSSSFKPPGAANAGACARPGAAGVPVESTALHVPTTAAAAAAPASEASRVVAVLYTNTAKYKKKSDRKFADGILELTAAGGGQLFDMDGKLVSKSSRVQVPKTGLDSGAVITLNNLVCEVDRAIDHEDFRRGVCFVSDTPAVPSSAPRSLVLAMPRKPACGVGKPESGAPAAGGSGRLLLGGRGPAAAAGGATGAQLAAAPPLYDPNHPDAVLLNGSQWAHGEGRLRNGRPVTPVLVDPYLARHMRPHQREGVRWLYEGVIGLRTPGRTGVILADEMGLGKTLQTLALLWTLMRQGPEGAPVVRKALVVAPASLVNNWAAETKKWLGTERIRALVLSSQGAVAQQQVSDFKLGSVWHLLLASYESMRRFGPELAGVSDLLVCDEGHRLKSAGGNKTIEGLLALGCDRRVVLTGTPVQNDLMEFYALLSFATPGVLGPTGTFKRVYADPISRSRDKDATPAEKELGAARAAELQLQAGAYVLRRTQDILARHLPPLSTFTLFVQPSDLQVSVYRSVLKSKAITQLLYGGGGSDEGVLPAITVLRKLCNHPKLLLAAGIACEGSPCANSAAVLAAPAAADAALSGAAAAAAAAMHDALKGRGVGGAADEVAASGKLAVLSTLLERVLATGGRAVVVSTSTATLDLINATLCQPNNWAVARIDGGTSVEERQGVVDRFNKFDMGRVFLLSTRAGGAGLNLVGANHLVLFDSDWNPAMDKQAMARIWRDGQTKPCFVYRLLTTGTLEEKVYQRQLLKSDLASATIEAGGGGARGLSQAELKQLFRLQVGSSCSTREVIGAAVAAGIEWLELGSPGVAGVPGLAAACSTGLVTDANKETRAAAAAMGQDVAAVRPAEGGAWTGSSTPSSSGGQGAAVTATGGAPAPHVGTGGATDGVPGAPQPTLDFAELEDSLD